MKRALIELDGIIDTGFCGQFSRWKDKYLPNMEMSDFFDTIITDAYDNKLAVWQAILDSDEIWIDSSWIGDSGRLLVKMLDNADKFKISNKTVINMRDYTRTSWHLPDDARVLIDRVKVNNVVFVYSDDLEYKNYLPK